MSDDSLGPPADDWDHPTGEIDTGDLVLAAERGTIKEALRGLTREVHSVGRDIRDIRVKLELNGSDVTNVKMELVALKTRVNMSTGVAAAIFSLFLVVLGAIVTKLFS